MKTIKQAAERSGISEKLIRAVVRQTGKENLEDIARHGVDGGFAGFTYYSDTIKFFKRQRKEICFLVHNMAEQIGEMPVQMVAGFNCLAGGKRSASAEFERAFAKAAAEYCPSISRCLYGGRLTEEDTNVANALAWFAAEEVARAMTEEE